MERVDVCGRGRGWLLLFVRHLSGMLAVSAAGEEGRWGNDNGRIMLNRRMQFWQSSQYLERAGGGTTTRPPPHSS